MKKRDDLRGFTIIEVTLVLAIAGLIFLMVFVALPGLRASQRDAQRRDDVIMFLENVKRYQSNNRGTLPGSADSGSNNVIVTWNDAQSSSNNATSWRGFYRDYLKKDFMDPDGVNYRLQVVKCGKSADVACTGYNDNLKKLEDASFPNDYTITVVLQATCSGDKAVGASNPRKLAVIYRLEGAGTYCNNT